MARFSKATQRDIETIKEAAGDFIRSLRTPWTYIPGLVAAVLTAFFMLLPFLVEPSELPW